MRNYTFIDSDTLVLCATNEGKLYAKHCEMAQANASTQEWAAHILNTLLPCLSGPSGGYRGEKLAVLDLETAAEMLASYYVEENLVSPALVVAG